jgi:hypothetical protein
LIQRIDDDDRHNIQASKYNFLPMLIGGGLALPITPTERLFGEPGGLGTRSARSEELASSLSRCSGVSRRNAIGFTRFNIARLHERSDKLAAAAAISSFLQVLLGQQGRHFLGYGGVD